MMWRMLGADDPMEAHKVDSRGIYARGRSEDVKKGVTSFLEKRPAKFKNRCRATCRIIFHGGTSGSMSEGTAVIRGATYFFGANQASVTALSIMCR
jgi:hypothetical protein